MRKKRFNGCDELLAQGNVTENLLYFLVWHVFSQFGSYSYEDFQDRLAHLKRQCEPHLVATVKGSVEQLCIKIYHLSAEHARKIRERNLQMLKENGIPPPAPPTAPPILRKVWCYPVQFVVPPVRMPVLEYSHERDHMVIKYSPPNMPQSDTQYINMTHLQKLVRTF